MDQSAKKVVADWIAQGLKKPGKTQAGLARALGISQPQISAITSGNRSIKVEEISALEDYLDAPFPYSKISSATAGDVAEVEGMAGMMPVIFRVAAGVWMETDGAEIITSIPFARDPSYAATRRQYAVQVLGESMDKVLPDGAFAIVVEANGQEPVNGDLVIVKRTHRGMIERTIKRYVVTRKGAELRPESSDPRFKPLPVDGDDDTIIEIEGFVIGRYERLGR